MAVVLDTHAWVWSWADSSQLSTTARKLIDAEDALLVSSVTLYEIGQKVRLGKWNAMVPFIGRFEEIAKAQDADFVPVGTEIAALAASLDWPHRDPFDRLVAATALVDGLELLSADPVFDQLPTLRRVWE